jgi:hypothetical protein
MNGVTYLSDLPELDALERGPPQIPDMGNPGGMGMGKFIRNNYNRPTNPNGGYSGMSGMSGMYDEGPPNGSMAENIGAGGYHVPPVQTPAYSESGFDNSGLEMPYAGDSGAVTSNKGECTCMDVYDHVNLCPICKAFYMQGRNNTILYVIIAALVLLCAYMGKRLYDIQLKRASR